MTKRNEMPCFGEPDLLGYNSVCPGFCAQFIACYTYMVESKPLKELPVYLTHEHAEIRRIARVHAERLGGNNGCNS